MKLRKTLLLIRHAHRDILDREIDLGLSEKGRRQAQFLTQQFEQVYLPEIGQTKTQSQSEIRVFTSPKRRCRETVEAIARLAGVSLEEEEALLEQLGDETDFAFKQRVERFIEWWKKKAPSWTVVCSHGDWLPLALECLIGMPIELKKGALAEVVWNGPGTSPCLRSLLNLNR